MAKNKLAKNKIHVSTQQYLDIAEIRDNSLIMRDGTLRSVMMVSSINFALKSEEEQNAVIAGYVSFLNNLDFPLQIVIQSREMNIDNYLNDLQEKQKNQANELLKIQTAEYLEYIKELISIGKIMSKRFYVCISYNPLSDKHRGFFSSLLEAFRPATLIKMREERFQRYRKALDKRVNLVSSGLGSIGLSVVELDTQGLIELFYNSYNPVTSKNQPLVDVNDLRLT